MKSACVRCVPVPAIVRFSAIAWLSMVVAVASAADEASWAFPEHAYRTAVAVAPGAVRRKQTPVGVDVDFRRMLEAEKISGRVDPLSIRVVRYDPRTGRPVPYEGEAGTVEIPYQLTGDFADDDAGHIWWRMCDEQATHYHIYFDTLGERPAAPPQRRGLIGVGDVFHYNNDRPGPAPVHPLHSQFWHLDWDGDGLRDLIGFGYRRYEYGAPLERNLGNGVYFLKNVGVRGKPLFAPRRRLKADDGDYLQTDLLPQNMFPVDWNRDGHVDFIGVDGRKNLLLWENAGTRDRDRLYVLKQPRVLTALTAVSPFRAETPGVIRKPAFYIRAVNPVDWNDDGGRDLIVAWSNTNILKAVDAKRGVIPYGAPLMIFELWEDASNGKNDPPTFAPPRIITEERGLPLHATCYATAGAASYDWDGDGDDDLLFQDGTDRPLEGGRLMFAENFGTRREPAFLMPIPILSIADSPQIVDWNDDGLVDLFAGGEFFENVNPRTGGTTERPVRDTTASGSRLPRAGSFPKLVSRGPALQTDPEMLGHWAAAVDWNGDGTLDVVRGVKSRVRFFANRGTNLNPVFDFGADLTADGADIYLPNWLDPDAELPADRGPQGMGEAEHGWLNPTAADFDRDGDLDLFVTGQRWQTAYYENVGTRTAPKLARGREVRFQGDPQEFSWRSKPSVGDLDDDGRAELIVTSDDDNVFYAYAPATAQPEVTVLEFDARRPLTLADGQPVKGWYGGQNNNGDNHSVLVDWDADGDQDLLNGSLWNVYYYENVGTRSRPVFRAHGRMQVGGEDLFVFRHAGSVDAADFNGDGRSDLVVSTENPSDQPIGEIIHLFDRDFLEDRLPVAALGKFERRDETTRP